MEEAPDPGEAIRKSPKIGDVWEETKAWVGVNREGTADGKDAPSSSRGRCKAWRQQAIKILPNSSWKRWVGGWLQVSCQNHKGILDWTTWCPLIHSSKPLWHSIWGLGDINPTSCPALEPLPAPDHSVFKLKHPTPQNWVRDATLWLSIFPEFSERKLDSASDHLPYHLAWPLQPQFPHLRRWMWIGLASVSVKIKWNHVRSSAEASAWARAHTCSSQSLCPATCVCSYHEALAIQRKGLVSITSESLIYSTPPGTPVLITVWWVNT